MSKLGHAGLLADIAAEIERQGPVTFARFMELALYHPRYGYYTSVEEAATLAPAERIGFDGDYYTSPQVHPVLAQALARQIAQVDRLLGQPPHFTVVEMGPGTGRLAHDLLAALAAWPGDLKYRLHYHLVERSPALQAVQRRLLGSAPLRVSWLESLEALDPSSVVGVLLSNELVDAFPVHRVTLAAGRLQEIYVSRGPDGGWVEQLGPPSRPALIEYVDRLRAHGIRLHEGCTVEINLEALRWIRSVARVLGRGIVITIDYGHTAQDLYAPERRRGTLLCYYRQMISENPYERVGQQDMTAHVDFTTLAAVGREAGLSLTGFTNQMSFLIGLGVEELIESLEPGTPEFQAVVQLLRPDGMGRTFKVLIQHKGMETPQLDGLRYRPFFGDILAPAEERTETIAAGARRG